MDHEEIRQRGFKRRTRVDDAREIFAERCSPIDETDDIALQEADSRVVASSITASNNIPQYDRAAMDGWAVRAADTVGASDRSPVILDVAQAMTENAAVRVHTGSEMPAGADAVVKIENADHRGETVEIFRTVGELHNVGQTGEDVHEGMALYEAGTRLRPSDLALLKGLGMTNIPVVSKPRVAVLPTGEELVEADPKAGEVIETNGLMVTKLVERWGALPSYRSIIPDEQEELESAILADCDHDLIVTTGGSSVGERDLVPEIVDSLGEVLVHGVALKPGHPVALGVVKETPIVMLPGYPVACLVNAVQFVRPAISWLLGTEPVEPPSVSATLDRKLRSEAGHRTFARVSLQETESGYSATPTRASGSGVLSSVTLADGWVVVPESHEGIEEGTAVTVEQWEWLE